MHIKKSCCTTKKGFHFTNHALVRYLERKKNSTKTISELDYIICNSEVNDILKNIRPRIGDKNTLIYEDFSNSHSFVVDAKTNAIITYSYRSINKGDSYSGNKKRKRR